MKLEPQIAELRGALGKLAAAVADAGGAAGRPIVIVESPFAGDVERNRRYLAAALRDCLLRGEAPFASHAIYTLDGVLDDLVPTERALGIEAGFAFRAHAERTVVYADLGISSGMAQGIQHARTIGHRIDWRSLPDWEGTP